MPVDDLAAAATAFVDVGAARLRTATWGAGPAEIVLLHDGLGSIAQWRDVPAGIHRRTGATVCAYERAGHGASTPMPIGPWPADWLHREAHVLTELLDVLGIEAPLLVGHSDGGSIGLIHAAGHDAATSRRCSGVIAIAAHSWVESVCADNIRAMRADPHRFVTGLARHHDHPGAVFEAWSGVWVSDEFARWDIRPLLASITCPVLLAQGTDDKYATDRQLTATAEAIGAATQIVRLDGVGHSVHHQAPDRVVDLVATFYDHHHPAATAAQGD